MAGLTEFAENNQLKGSHFTAIGAFHEALFGWFDGEKKAYKKIPITQQVEVISLVGDIGLIDGKPAVHAHGVVGLPDGTTRGGHLISATVWPTVDLRRLRRLWEPQATPLHLQSGHNRFSSEVNNRYRVSESSSFCLHCRQGEQTKDRKE
jgi:predicted DNA-binding protein with PD1-like motif